jgi:hypothetical protein
MFKRMKVWLYVSALTAASLYQFGCGNFINSAWWPYNSKIDTFGNVIVSILREDLFS